FRSSELHVKICNEPLISTDRIDLNADRCSAGAERVIPPPAIIVAKTELHSIGQRVSRVSPDAMHIQMTVENVVIDQVRIERVLLRQLIPNVDLPIVFGLYLANTEADFIRVALVPLARVACGSSTIVGFKIDAEIAEDAHRQLTDFPANFHRYLQDQ